MTTKGKKHRCSKCGKNYYDLGKKEHSCPSCKAGTDSVRNGNVTKHNSIKSNNEKPKKQHSVNLSAELFYVDENNHTKIKHTFSGQSAVLDGDVNRAGWHIGLLNESSRRINADKDTLWLGKLPRAGLMSYLASDSFPGIGQQTAQKIVQTFRNSELMLLFQGKQKDFPEYEVPASAVEKVTLLWKEKMETNAWSILMHEVGFTPQQQIAVRREMGSGIISIIRNSPFKLLGKIPRFSFDDATELSNRFGIEISEEDRTLAAANFWLEKTEQERRHTCAPIERVFNEVSTLVKLDKDTIGGYLTANDKAFHSGERRNKPVLSTLKSALRDTKITNELKRIIKNGKSQNDVFFTSETIETSKGIDLSEEQVNAINTAINNPISIITGGPGAGKTTMVQGLVSALKQLKKDIQICAPTGRAAKRIAETPKLSSFNPSTIHMYLAKLGTRTAKQDFMIVDESSMVDLDLMVKLLKSIPNGCSVVFIGDPDQLPPVGSGQPFKDMIEAATIEVARLTGNFRQDSFSDTVKAARAVIRGNLPSLEGSISETDFVFIEKPGPEQCDVILQLYFDTLPSILGNHFTDNQILAPQRPGHVGITRLNSLIQSRLSSGSKPVLTKKSGNDEVHIFVGDKVINRENNYELGVMNGDVGTVMRENGSNLIVEFEMPGTRSYEVEFPAKEKYNLDLAYALTVHSSQGSEYPGVIIPVTSAHSHMLSRNLLYTAITRGKKQVCLVGERTAFEKAVALFMKDFRYTLLTEKLAEAFK